MERNGQQPNALLLLFLPSLFIMATPTPVPLTEYGTAKIYYERDERTNLVGACRVGH